MPTNRYSDLIKNQLRKYTLNQKYMFLEELNKKNERNLRCVDRLHTITTCSTLGSTLMAKPIIASCCCGSNLTLTCISCYLHNEMVKEIEKIDRKIKQTNL